VLTLRRSARPLLWSAAVAAAVAGSLGYLAHVWPAPEPVPDLSPRPAATLVPITGTAGGQCLAFLDEFLRHPNWQVTVTRADHTITVDELGRGSHVRRGAAAVALHLTPVQIRQLHLAAEASCEPDGRGPPIDLTWGGPDSAGRTLPPSEASRQLVHFMSLALTD
jgi:hypothetical protein